jgi:hypothetical protein
MPPQPPAAPEAPQAPVLPPPEAATRIALLTELQAALTRLGVQSMLARRHRLVLRYADNPVPPSGPTNPTLHVFAASTLTVSTDSTTYRISTGQELPAGDPAAAAALIFQHPAGQHVTNPASRPATPT